MSRWSTPILALALAIVVFVLAPATGEAGRPVYKGASEDRSSFNNAKVVDDSEVSYSYYAELSPGRPDIYQVYARQGQAFNPSLLVPRSDDLKSFAPSMALVGPGIGDPTASARLSELPVKPPTDTGVLVVSYQGDTASRPTYSDPLTLASYWKGPEWIQAYPRDGPYYVVVWDKSKRGGRYVLTIGERDEFGLVDLVKYPYTWAKLQLWFGNWTALGIAAVALAALVFVVVRLLSRRRKNVRTT